MTRPSPDDYCAECGSVLVPPQLASGLRIPSTADYVCLKCGQAYSSNANPPHLSRLAAVDTTTTKSVPTSTHVHRSASRILIVEDDENTLDSYARMLRVENYEVYTAVNAATGLRMLDARPVDAMIVDLVMPDMSGLDFLRQVRARDDYRSTPIALVTGHYFTDDDIGVELKALHAVVRYKPLWFEDLTQLVHGLLNDM